MPCCGFCVLLVCFVQSWMCLFCCSLSYYTNYIMLLSLKAKQRPTNQPPKHGGLALRPTSAQLLVPLFLHSMANQECTLGQQGCRVHLTLKMKPRFLWLSTSQPSSQTHAQSTDTHVHLPPLSFLCREDNMARDLNNARDNSYRMSVHKGLLLAQKTT